VLDEPTTGLHPLDVDRLLLQLEQLVDAGATVIVVEHDMQIIARSDHIIDMGPGAGDEGGQIVVSGTPDLVARSSRSKTARFLREALAGRDRDPSRGASYVPQKVRRTRSSGAGGDAR
jgi:excinuclease ABC subunit A